MVSILFLRKEAVSASDAAVEHAVNSTGKISKLKISFILCVQG